MSAHRLARGERPGPPPLRAGLAVGLLLLSALLLGLPAPAAASSGLPLHVTITGPSLLAENESGTFVATASGGPAEALNGTFIGNYTFTDSLIGVNTTGGFVTPPSGAFIGQTINLTVGGLNHSGTYTLELNVTSNGDGHNVTQIFSQQFQIVQPYLLIATVQNLNTYTVSNALILVYLDGAQVGDISIPSLSPSGSTSVRYNYTTLGLASGWHTFTMVIQGPGLLEFSNGQSSYSVSFYVNAPATDYTWYYLAGLVITVLAILISLLIFAPRRPRKKRSG